MKGSNLTKKGRGAFTVLFYNPTEDYAKDSPCRIDVCTVNHGFVLFIVQSQFNL